jgi:uncharacterized protein
MGNGANDKKLTDEVARIEAQERARPIVAQILKRLKAELPSSLRYHTPAHTDDVLHEALLFGVAGGLAADELELLAIASSYHDAGFLKQVLQNESIGAAIATEAMIQFGYSTGAQTAVRAMIEDTQLKKVGDGFVQVPTTELSKYLCDADLSNLGRTDFLEKAELVREELGVPRSVDNYERVLKLVQSHRWYTSPAQQFRQAQKELNTAALQEVIRSMRAT